jgi:hypothetical protein
VGHSENFSIVLGTPVRRNDPSKAPEPKPEPKPDPEPKRILHRGIIGIRNQADNSVGYISRSPSSQAQYHYDADASNALVVTFETDLTGSGAQLNILPEVGLNLLWPRAPILTSVDL